MSEIKSCEIATEVVVEDGVEICVVTVDHAIDGDFDWSVVQESLRPVMRINLKSVIYINSAGIRNFTQKHLNPIPGRRVSLTNVGEHIILEAMTFPFLFKNIEIESFNLCLKCEADDQHATEFSFDYKLDDFDTFQKTLDKAECGHSGCSADLVLDNSDPKLFWSTIRSHLKSRT